jgi:hypothetical protein
MIGAYCSSAREKFISISARKVDVEEIKEEFRVEVEQQNKRLQLTVNSPVTENMDLKNRLQLVERKLEDIAKTFTNAKDARLMKRSRMFHP